MLRLCNDPLRTKAALTSCKFIPSTGVRLEWPFSPRSIGRGRRHSAGLPSRRKRESAGVLGAPAEHPSSIASRREVYFDLPGTMTYGVRVEDIVTAMRVLR